MCSEKTKIDLGEWSERVKSNETTYIQRQATEILINAIANTPYLHKNLALKGGVLMGLAYKSPRQTADIDLTTSFSPSEEIGKRVENLLNTAMVHAAAALGFPDLGLRVHSMIGKPKKIFPNADFPALSIKIKITQRSLKKKLAERTDYLLLDISFNEPESELQILEFGYSNGIFAYTLAELIAEKFRAMLQQVIRNRNRRQDVYDIDLLIRKFDFDENLKKAIYDALLKKCRARSIEPVVTSIDHPEVQQRAGAEWNSLQLEIGDVPDFEESFSRVADFYRRLPWSSS